MPYVLGLTGNIASGKTTIGLMLLALGAQTYVDADLAVHELYLPGSPLVPRLAEAFGPGILDAEGGVDRRVLGAIVFGDQTQLRRLEEIVHPAVQGTLIGRFRTLSADAIGVLDAIKLIESGYAPFCRGVWLVTCPPAIQLRRLMETRGLSRHEAEQRLAAQPPLDDKREIATEIIDNSGSLDALRAQVMAAWERFTRSLA